MAGIVRSARVGSDRDPALDAWGDYGAARADFIRRAKALHAQVVVQYGHPDHPDLSTDVAAFGPRGDAALVVVSGTHGIEGHAGSAIQRRHLERLAGAGVRVVVIHALNPYGFAHDRRVNEDNVDVNRNFHAYPDVPVNTDYRTVHELVVPPDWNGPQHRACQERLLGLVGDVGLHRVQQAVTGGQHEYADGLFFGGTAPAWSNVTLRRVIRDQVAGAGKVAYIDLHTGLGRRAAGEAIFRGGDDAGAFERARRWYGPEVTSSQDGTSSSTPISGNTARAVIAELGPDVETTAITLEFGTVDAITVLAALQGDNWFSMPGRRGQEGYAAVREAMYAAFAPWDDDWWSAVRKRAGVVFEQALVGLRTRAGRDVGHPVGGGAQR